MLPDCSNHQPSCSTCSGMETPNVTQWCWCSSTMAYGPGRGELNHPMHLWTSIINLGKSIVFHLNLAAIWDDVPYKNHDFQGENRLRSLWFTQINAHQEGPPLLYWFITRSNGCECNFQAWDRVPSSVYQLTCRGGGPSQKSTFSHLIQTNHNQS